MEYLNEYDIVPDMPYFWHEVMFTRITERIPFFVLRGAAKNPALDQLLSSWIDNAVLRMRRFWHAAVVVGALFLYLSSSAIAGQHPRHWAKVEGQGCRDTRAVVIASQCTVTAWTARQGHPEGCTVKAAVCIDPYSGAEVTTDTVSSAIQIDHVLPVHVAESRRTWTEAEWTVFYNDRDNLLAVRSKENGRKSDRMPDTWCPADAGVRPALAQKVERIAARYRIELRKEEVAGLKAWEKGECAAGAVIVGQ